VKQDDVGMTVVTDIDTDSGITESYNEMGKGVGTNTNNDDITRGYN
jgi:hypothetical protein